ncbi:MAG: hypothetical protein ACKODX_07970 [Gemmata sp.]
MTARVAPDDTLRVPSDFCTGGFAEARSYRARIRCESVFLAWGARQPG